MKKRFKSMFFIILAVMTFTSCGLKDNIYLKLGLKNDKFEYIKDGNVKNIVIQSIRDKNFKFIISDTSVIDELYEILSKGRISEEKSKLEPDYSFEIHMKNKDVKKYYYVAGLDRENKGNFYNDSEKFILSKRLDNDLIKNFFNIRTPINFKNVYYNSIIKSIEKMESIQKQTDFNVYLKADKEASKFIVSVEENEFKKNLKDAYPNAVLNENTESEIYDIFVKTVGYKSKIMKIVIELKRNGESLQKLYVVNDYINQGWVTNVYEEKPSDFKE